MYCYFGASASYKTDFLFFFSKTNTCYFLFFVTERVRKIEGSVVQFSACPKHINKTGFIFLTLSISNMDVQNVEILEK